MECQRIVNLLDTTSDSVPKFVTKKWVEVNQSGGSYNNTNKQIRFKAPMLRSDLCGTVMHILLLKELLLLKKQIIETETISL